MNESSLNRYTESSLIADLNKKITTLTQRIAELEAELLEAKQMVVEMNATILALTKGPIKVGDSRRETET